MATLYSGRAATGGTETALVRWPPMAGSYISQLAEQWVAQHGDEAGQHLAEAIQAMREVGDDRGARLLMKIWQHVVQMDGPASYAPRTVKPIIPRGS